MYGKSSAWDYITLRNPEMALLSGQRSMICIIGQKMKGVCTLLTPELLPDPAENCLLETNSQSADCNLYPPHARLKYCTECSAEFLCGPQTENGDCWCDRLPTIMPLRSPIEQCLCSACLEKAIRKMQEA